MNAIGDRLWPVWNRLVGVHVAMYRATGGRIGHRMVGAPPMLLLDHVGARSGIKRTTALAYMKDDDSVVVVASKGGHPQHPAWYHNLRANPDTVVQIGPERRPVTAHVATPEERARLWPRVVGLYGGFGGYQERTDREIPLVILRRR
jgi:deazaflavin-dependent oxidoreductase (nitroreductase family)